MMPSAAEKFLSDWEKIYQATTKIVLSEIFFSVGLIIFGWFWAALSDNSVNSGAISLIWATIILLTIASFILRRVLFTTERLNKLSKQNQLLQGLQTNYVFLNLVGVIVAIFGFIVSTLSGNRFEIMRAGIVALIIFLTNFPRKVVWSEIVQKFERG